MLILLALIEALGAPGWVAHRFGAAALAGRLLHARSCAADGRGWTRIAGMAPTSAVLDLGEAGLAAHAALRIAIP